MPAEAAQQLPPGVSLDLHEGITRNRVRDDAACSRWPEHHRLLSSQGELVRGRCKATNLCAYCAKLAAVENAELLNLDAMYGPAPRLSAVLTTPSADPCPASFYQSRWQLSAAARKELPGFEVANLFEMTTGYAPRSGGVRRPHWNLLVKTDAEPDDAREIFRQLVEAIWCRREGASPAGQYVELLRQAADWTRYVALHFQKEPQSPPLGWSGHRFSTSRGYLWTDTPTARQEARESLRAKREIWKASRRGLGAHDAELAAHEAQQRARETTWRLVQHLPGQPSSPTDRALLQAKKDPPGARPGPRPREGAGETPARTSPAERTPCLPDAAAA